MMGGGGGERRGREGGGGGGGGGGRGGGGGAVKGKEGKRLPGFCQLASVLRVKEAENSVRNMMTLDSLCTHKFCEVGQQYLRPEKNINCEAGGFEVNTNNFGAWVVDKSG